MRSARNRWVAAWVGAVPIAIANGAIRDGTYGKLMSEHRAGQISLAPMLVALFMYFRALQRRWPVADRREAMQIGAAWAALTVGFEFGFGRLVTKDSWEELLEAYDVRRGNLWPLAVVWVAVGPEVARELSPPASTPA